MLRVTLKPKPRLKKLIFDIDMGELAIKGRSSRGNMVTKNDVHKVTLKEKGASTLGGRKIYFDDDVKRLNVDKRGRFFNPMSHARPDFNRLDLTQHIFRRYKTWKTNWRIPPPSV